MRINSRPKEKFKLPREARFKGEQRSLNVRSGTIAKFNQKAAYSYTSSQKQFRVAKRFKKKKFSLNQEYSLVTEKNDKTKISVSSNQLKEEKTSFKNKTGKKKASSLTNSVEGKASSFTQKNDKKARAAADDKKFNESKFTKKKKRKSIKNKREAAHSDSVYSSSIKKAGKMQFLDQSFNVLDQEEDTEGLQQFKSNAKNTEYLFKGSKKVSQFVTKNQKFSQSVTNGKLDTMRFALEKKAKSAADSTIRLRKKTTLQQVNISQVSSKIQYAIKQATSKVVSSFTVNNPIGWLIVGVASLFLIFFGLLFMFNSQSNASSNDGVFYVKHWDGDNAYHSSLLAQRYGITAEQIDSFIANEGYTVDSRATGQEFLRLQSISGIDVRMLVAFAQMESSFGTAGVALQFPKANIFGYGAFDNDPNQGTAWDNTRAVTDFRSTQIDTYGNRTLAFMDARASAYHNNTLKPGEFVYWTKLDAGKVRAEIAEKFDRWIDANGGTPEPPGGYGPIGGGGAGLAVLDQRLGTVIGGEFGGLAGECYAVSAFYANSINPSIILRGGIKASDIGTDYPWVSWGWTVIGNPRYKDIRAGDIINYKAGDNMGPWRTDALYGHTGVVGKVLGNNQYILYDQNPGPLKTWTVTFYPNSVASVIRPPK